MSFFYGYPKMRFAEDTIWPVNEPLLVDDSLILVQLFVSRNPVVYKEQPPMELKKNTRYLFILNRFTCAWLPPVAYPSPYKSLSDLAITFRPLGIVSHHVFAVYVKERTRSSVYVQLFQLNSALDSLAATRRIDITMQPPRTLANCIGFSSTPGSLVMVFFFWNMDRGVVDDVTVITATNAGTSERRVSLASELASDRALSHAGQLYFVCRDEVGHAKICSHSADGNLTQIASVSELAGFCELDDTNFCWSAFGSQFKGVSYCLYSKRLVVVTYDVESRQWQCSLPAPTLVNIIGLSNVLVFTGEVLLEERNDEQLRGVRSVWTARQTLSMLALRAVQRNINRKTLDELAKESHIGSVVELTQFLLKQ